MAKRHIPASSPAPLDGRALPWLLLALALALLPHTLHLPWWLNTLFITALAWRWLAAQPWLKLTLPYRWLLFVMTLSIIAALVATYGLLIGRDAGVALLTAMAAMKLLEARTLRDGMVLVFLGFFLLIAELLYSQSIFVAIYLFVVVTLLLSAQNLLHTQHQRIPPVACLRLSGKMVLQSIPVMLVLFILFPRVPGPLWSLPENSGRGLTGLSDTMSPGSINELIQSDQVAFRVRFDQAAPPSNQLYWRGLVLSRFEDGVWSASFRDESLSRSFPYEDTTGRVDYTVMLEPHGQPWLFALDVPARVPDKSYMTRSFQLRHRTPVNDRLQYRMSSYLQYRTVEPQIRYLRRFMRPPGDSNPRAQELAAQWHPLAEIERVRAALTMFRRQPFYYTLTPPLLGGENDIDEFLFDSRRGFCEHYAGSFVFLMRAAGVPARVVIGYQGGEQNGDYLIVRQSDAHAWAEVWLDQQGWVRVDPTAAVAPDRVEHGLFAAVDDPDALPFLARRHSSWLRRLALSWDKINTAWNEWVLGYNISQQRRFLAGWGLQYIDWRGMTIMMIVILAAMLLSVVAWQMWQRHRNSDPLSRIYQQFCSKLARHDLARRNHEGPLAFTERIAGRRPDLAGRVRTIGRLYALLRFADHTAEDSAERQQRLQRLQTLVAGLKVKPSA